MEKGMGETDFLSIPGSDKNWGARTAFLHDIGVLREIDIPTWVMGRTGGGDETRRGKYKTLKWSADMI